MAKIGAFGGVTFEISDNRKLLLTSFEQTESSRWSDLELAQLKPVSKFIGPDLETITYSILLKATEGVNPDAEMNKLRKMNRTGNTDFFIRGNKPISSNRYSIRQITESHRQIDNLGNVLQIEATINIKEHVIYPKKIKKTVQAVSKQATGELGAITVTTQSIHIRSGPGKNYKVLGYAMKGNKLNVKSVSNGWYNLGGGKYITADSTYSTLKRK